MFRATMCSAPRSACASPFGLCSQVLVSIQSHVLGVTYPVRNEPGVCCTPCARRAAVHSPLQSQATKSDKTWRR